ncbi:histidine kinase [Paenibacillus sp. P96]|uniref:Histidine kinase n=1 Tax=Paenibacillus zeirhizosphaerae TaxID=2987519 RepID=A0ABT9FRY0_9BACL|nr:histidine kinase [Paenibacillus sp. P96]MDP4097385.1 histidine kinase [Paenibacillus sp. P96]
MLGRLREHLLSQSIRNKLLLTAIACVLLPAAISLLTYNALTQEAVQRQAMSNAQDSLQLVNGSVTGLFKSMLNIANYIQVDADMNSYFKIINAGGSVSSEPYAAFVQEKNILEQLESLTVIGDKSYVTVLLTNGKTYTNYSTSDYNPVKLTREPWFWELDKLRGFQSYWVATRPTVFSMEKLDNPYQISVARTLRLDNGEIYGYIIVTVMENQVNAIFDRLSAGQEVMLVDRSNRILSHKDRNRIGQELEYQFPEHGGSAGSAVMKAGEAQYLVADQFIAFNDWRLVSVQPYKQAAVNISSIFKRVFLFQLVSFFFFLLLLITLLRAFTKPLVILGKVTAAVQTGNLDVRSGIRGQDEIGRLGFLFDQMLDRVKQMLAEVSETQARKRKAELRMLQAQINPHFLFNVLNSIRMKAMRGGDQDSAKMIGSLSRLLRMTITNENDDIHLHEEIDLITCYVELMNLRQKEEVELKLDITSEAFMIQVPRFFLQPIVENAIIHGLGQSRGMIAVRAVKLDGAFELSVEDDGNGMNEEELDQLRRSIHTYHDGILHGREELRSRFSGIGLPNVMERMRMVFGDGFRMDVRSRQGNGTQIVMRIPERGKASDV